MFLEGLMALEAVLKGMLVGVGALIQILGELQVE